MAAEILTSFSHMMASYYFCAPEVGIAGCGAGTASEQERYKSSRAFHVSGIGRAETHDSSSTVGDASWPQPVDSPQGDACPREILVSRLICKYLEKMLVISLRVIHDSYTS